MVQIDRGWFQCLKLKYYGHLQTLLSISICAATSWKVAGKVFFLSQTLALTVVLSVASFQYIEVGR
jgi:hypothetical protein